MNQFIKSKYQWLPVFVFWIVLVIIVVLHNYILLSFAQENGSLQASTSNKDEITFSWLGNFILSLLSAGIAAGLAAFFTYKISHGLENKREEKNKKAQIDFNIRVVQLISSETVLPRNPRKVSAAKFKPCSI